ncbi:hypothetical protein OWR29_37140 [Actinoplanes sp. Pm04-4]|uniref:Uncharacterized protein n=1 Tax=Paractinoplanes pyxinae TaxID=2997416 RepID=A0ABT4BAW6_9ACTN|nr:hypothetical protein [Actinoplanes pyxinae]MCY1143660.1 hypothetical protein [Actinoplanes pyxinae]
MSTRWLGRHHGALGRRDDAVGKGGDVSREPVDEGVELVGRHEQHRLTLLQEHGFH